MTAERTQSDARIDAFLASFLRGAPISAAELAAEDVATRACYHGLQGLLVEDPRFAEAAPAAHRALFRIAAADAISDVLHLEILREICAAFAADGIEALFLKGTALAYLAYARPSLRPRLDTDILVAPDRLAAAGAALERLGFSAPPDYAPRYQRTFVREQSGFSFPVDLHWRTANSEVVSQVYDFDTMSAGRQAIDPLHPRAFAPSDELLLSFAITHLLFDRDYREGMRLIWLEDFRVIAARLDPAAWERFTALETAIGGCGAAALALERAEALLGRFVPEAVMDCLATAPEGRLSRYLAASEFGRLRRDLLCRDRRQALGHVRAMLFPPRARLAEIYGPVPRWQVPLFYLRRATGGILKAKRRSDR